jgi:hypothetical protein
MWGLSSYVWCLVSKRVPYLLFGSEFLGSALYCDVWHVT